MSAVEVVLLPTGVCIQGDLLHDVLNTCEKYLGYIAFS